MKMRVLFLSSFLFFLFITPSHAQSNQYVYDYANLLSDAEVEQLEHLAATLSAERNTAFIILTTNNTGGKGISKYMGDFYDDQALGYDKPNGNTVILSLDMSNRDVFLAGFGLAEITLDDQRLKKIRGNITPKLSNGEFYSAFEQYIEESHYYMQFEPGFNPDNILFKLWFQLAVAFGLACIVIGIMIASRGGRVTVNNSTYIDAEHSGVTHTSDQYVTTHITKVKKPSSNNSGGGGGFTGGGKSFSGSGGKF